MSHTKYSPSSYERWSVCTASVDAVDDDKLTGFLPEQEESSKYAVEGTVAHALFASCIDLDVSPRDFLQQEIYVEELGKNFVVDDEMVDEIDIAIDYVKTFLNPEFPYWCEIKVSLDKTLPGQKGTADLTIYDPVLKRLHVFDLKYGKGLLVRVENNGQLKLYGLGAFDQLLTYEQKRECQDVMLHIVQPRLNNIDSWVISKGDLERFRVEAYTKFMEANDPNKRKFVPGLHCWFCPRRPYCKPLADSIFSVVIEDEEIEGFDGLYSPDAMSDKQLAELFPMLGFISAWANNVRAYMETNALKGKFYEGLKLVEGKKGARQWRNETNAESYLSKMGIPQDELYEKTLLSVAKAENKIGRKNVDEEFKKLFTQTDGRPALTTEDDPRKPYDQVLIDEFDDD